MLEPVCIILDVIDNFGLEVKKFRLRFIKIGFDLLYVLMKVLVILVVGFYCSL